MLTSGTPCGSTWFFDINTSRWSGVHLQRVRRYGQYGRDELPSCFIAVGLSLVENVKCCSKGPKRYGSRKLGGISRESGKWASTCAPLSGNLLELVHGGICRYCCALGLRTLLGYAYMDAASSDKDLTRIINEIGLLQKPGMEDQMLAEITGGIFDPSLRPPGNYFLALAPLGHAALRLYVSRYLCERPLVASEFIYRVKLALRQEELDAASIAFLRDSATAEEASLMQGARERGDSYAFAFECLLGHLALNLPYRLHQIVSEFGWARPLEGT